MKRSTPFLALLLAGCVSATTPPPPIQQPPIVAVPVTLAPSQVKAVEIGIKRKLKDPESAQFPDPFKATKDAKDIVTVCGYVNAKNGFGGYNGKKPFVGVLMASGDFFVMGVGGSPVESASAAAMCQRYGMPLFF